MNKKLTKLDIAQKLLPYLKTKSAYFSLVKNSYFKYVKNEGLLQFFIVRILRDNGYVVLVNTKEGQKSAFERFNFGVMGNIKSRADLFVTECVKNKKGAWLELKAGYSDVFKKNGELKKSEHLSNQQSFLDRMKKQGFYAEFIFFENIESVLRDVFEIKKQ